VLKWVALIVLPAIGVLVQTLGPVWGWTRADPAAATINAAAPPRHRVLRVPAPALLAQTGGIVQGMSGSPILQNGRLVGAVTHVLVNDPTRGYGIFAQTMLEQAHSVPGTDAAA